jgi:uncharacterized membrane protein
MTTQAPAYRLLLACACLWCALLVLPPALSGLWPGSSAAGAVYALFSRVCHQWDSHSLHLFGVKLAVCVRCFAVYAGFLAGVLLAPRVHGAERWDARRAWLWAGAPMLADVLLGAASWYEPTTASRLLTGAWFGVIAGLLLTPPFVSAFSRYFSPRSAVTPQRTIA